MKIKELAEILKSMGPNGEVLKCKLQLNEVTFWELKDGEPQTTTDSYRGPLLTAVQAKKLTEMNMDKNIQPALSFVLKKVKEAAIEGRTSLIHPLQGLDGWAKSIFGDIEKSVMKKLELLGYKTEFHPNPDPGHPCSSSYWEVSW